MRLAVKNTIKQFLKTTTLHGFKYLCSPFYADRIGWVFCCCASACCAGMLCALLWAHFLDAPTLLVLMERNQDILLPSVGVCITPSRLAQLFAQKMSIDELQMKVSLPPLFHSLLSSKPLSEAQIAFLEHVLAKHKTSLADALVNVTEPCHSILRVCRVRNRVVPCDQLFHKEVGPTGVCCMATANTLNAVVGEDLINPRLSLVLQCSDFDDDTTMFNSCAFFTRFPNEEWVTHVDLTTGYSYRMPLIFTAIKDSNKEKLVDSTCVSRLDYSRKKCFIKCKEQKCGCSDPLSTHQDLTLPRCALSQINCLRSFKLIEESCSCPTSCRKLFSRSRLESSRIDQHAFDPFFAAANVTSVILDIQMHGASKTFDLMYTESWLSLLSSLGGLFNMFLGVGLFSALELIFLLVERLPVTFHRSSELPTPTPVPIRITAVQ